MSILRTILMLLGKVIAAVTGAGFSNGYSNGFASSPGGSPSRTLLFPHARFRLIERSTTAPDKAFTDLHYSDIDGGSLSSHPNAISVQRYALLCKMEIDLHTKWDTGTNTWRAYDSTNLVFLPGVSYDDGFSGVMCRDFAQAYATAHGQNVEDYWLHQSVGSPNYVMNILSISAAGVIVLKDLTHGGALSFPYQVGWVITITGASAGNGTYTIASIQQNGFTVTGWSAGAQGTLGNVSIPGDGTSSLLNRKTQFFWSEWRQMPNFGNANCRAMHVARIVTTVANGGNPINAILFDEMDSSNITSQQVQTTVEYATGGYAVYNIDVCTTLSAFLSAPGGPLYLRPNTSGYTAAGDIAIARAAGGIHNESALTLTNYDKTAIDYTIARVGEGIDVEFSNGDSWMTGPQNGGTPPNPGIDTSIATSVTVGNYPTRTARVQMALYCMYLQAVDASYTAADGSKRKHCIMDNTNGFQTTSNGAGSLASMWQPAFEYDIGQPIGGYTNTLVTDPAGFTMRTLMRTFSHDGTNASAIAYYNVNTSGQSNYGENSLVTITLPANTAGKQWYMLNADGTFGSTGLTTIGLRRTEGMVLVQR